MLWYFGKSFLTNDDSDRYVLPEYRDLSDYRRGQSIGRAGAIRYAEIMCLLRTAKAERCLLMLQAYAIIGISI